MRFIDHDGVATTGLAQANASAHLCCRWDCGLVARERKGREVHERWSPAWSSFWRQLTGSRRWPIKPSAPAQTFGSGDEHGDVCDGVEIVAEHADVTRRHDRMRTAVPGGARPGPPTWSPADMDDKGA